MKQLLLHPNVHRNVQAILRAHPHALLISGGPGAGKQTLAKHIAAQLLGSPIELSPYYTEIIPSTKVISIDQIRELGHFLQLKTTGRAATRRVAVLFLADSMTTEAQNALLKLLEEPPADTVIILTASRIQSLFPTIRSRTQLLHIQAPNLNDCVDYFAGQGYSLDQIHKAYAVSDGQVGLITALLGSDENNLLSNYIDRAKLLFKQSVFERLVQVEQLSKNKEDIPLLLFACKRIGLSAIEFAAKSDNKTSVSAWHGRLERIVEAEESLAHNPNPKLLMTDLLLHL